jgi:hypothetical protein
MAGNRLRYVDYWHFRFLNTHDSSSKAADEIIANPESHLLTQEQLFAAEGGVAGLGVQAGTIVVGLFALFAARPRVLTYLKNGQLRPADWALLAGTSLVSYRLGYNLGHSFAGDSDKVNNHWIAYFYQKQLNRFEGRQILTKAPKFY